MLAHANPDLSPRMDAAGRAGLYRLRKSSMALGVGTVSTTPARHPSSSEEGSIFNNSPPDSGGVAPWAPGWLYAGDSFSATCSAPPLQGSADNFHVPRPALPAALSKLSGKCGLGPMLFTKAGRSPFDPLTPRGRGKKNFLPGE